MADRGPIKIARNDPGLAHACARAALERLDGVSSALMIKAEQAKTLKAAFREIAESRPVIGRPKIWKESGVRARGFIAFLDGHQQGLEVKLARFDGRLRPRLMILNMGVTAPGPHVLARMMQRELGSDDEVEALSKLVPYVEALVRFNVEKFSKKQNPGNDLEVIAGGLGAVLIADVTDSFTNRAQPWGLRVKTFITESTLVDKDLKALAIASELQVMVRGEGRQSVFTPVALS